MGNRKSPPVPREYGGLLKGLEKPKAGKMFNLSKCSFGLWPGKRRNINTYVRSSGYYPCTFIFVYTASYVACSINTQNTHNRIKGIADDCQAFRLTFDKHSRGTHREFGSDGIPFYLPRSQSQKGSPVVPPGWPRPLQNGAGLCQTGGEAEEVIVSRGV